MTSQAPRPLRRFDFAMTALFLLSLVALLNSLFNYFSTGNGIHGSEGALLVIVSTLLLTLATGLIVNQRITGWVRGLFELLILLDFLGTALASYFLEAWILLALMVLAFIAWIAHFARPVATVSTAG